MIEHNLELLKDKDCLVICPTRIRPEQAKAMYNTFRKTSTYNSEVIFYIADDDPNIEEYKQELRNCAYIIDKRRTIIEVMNYISCERYPNRKYYSCIGDDNRYSTRKWDSEFIKEIEEKGRGWGFAYGNDLFQKEKLCGNPIISGNIIRALGFMALPVLKHQFVDNFWTDLASSINRIYYREDIIQEHLHPFANKGKMDANYDWIYKSGITQLDQMAYKKWFDTQFNGARQRIIKAMMTDYRSNGSMPKFFNRETGEYKTYQTISLCMICADGEKSKTLFRCLYSVADYVDEINIVFNYKRFKSWKTKELFYEANRFKAKFYYTKWTNFSNMKNKAISMATKDHILVLDVDDIMPCPMTMIDAIHFKPEVDSFKCQVYSDTPNGGRELILQHRIFKNNPKFSYTNFVHEDISYSMKEVDAKVCLTDIVIHHLGNIDRKHWLASCQRNYKMLTAEIKSGKGHTLTYFHLVNTLMIMKEYKRAMENVDYTLANFKLNPEDPILPKLRTLRGLCCMNLYDKTKDARYKMAAESDFLVSYGIDKNAEAAVNIAESYMIDKKWDEVIVLLEPLMENFMDVHSKNTNMPFDYKNIYLLMLRKLGDCYAIKEIWDKAEKYYREFLSIKPQDLETVDRICQVWRNCGKRGEANSMTAKAVNIWPSYYAGWSNLGSFELEMKRYVTAELFLRRALLIKPDHRESRHNLSMLKRITNW